MQWHLLTTSITAIFFPDETVDQVHPNDRFFQHILLQMLKPTFKHVMNANCYRLHGPTGVKYATQRIRKILAEKKPQFLIRADVKSFYRFIPHFKLIEDLKKYYNDPKLLMMLKEIIINPIDTPYGYKNPVHGIALRGPLSQFFSGIYLKPLDDAFNEMDVTYIRYQDDILILCQTKRQLNRARCRMMEVLHDGTSSRRIRCYLHRWVTWWIMTSNTWHYQELLRWFMDVCWHEQATHYANALDQLHFFRQSCIRSTLELGVAA